jgi:hypothetical protein
VPRRDDEDDEDEDSRALPAAPRSYTHKACGEATVVNGRELLALCDPFSATVGTYCVACETHFPLKEFVWDDTRERISAARARHGAMAPGWARALLRPSGCLGFVLLLAPAAAGPGYAVGRALGAPGWVFPVLAALGGAVAAVLILAVVVSPAVMRQYYGVSDWRELR